MAVETPRMDRPPAHDGELAPVIALDPSPQEEGFLNGELLRKGLTAADPLSVIGGVWRGVNHLKRSALGEARPHSAAVPQRVFVPLDGYEHLLLVTDPDPQLGIKPDEADTSWFKPGLGELGDIGSALRLHIAFAEQNPGRRVVTEATKGMSHTGKTVPASELRDRSIETMAHDSLRLMRRVISGGEIEIDATSLGTPQEVAIAEINLRANPADWLPITHLRFIASAAVAGKVEGTENFRPSDIDEDAYRDALSGKFQRHVGADFLRMLRSHPADLLECWPMLGAYAMAHPRKTYDRVMAMATDYANVKQGVDWSSLRYVVSEVPVSILDGEHDPLGHEQEPQWAMLESLFPGQVRRRVVQGMGHLMTVDARGTVRHLGEMERPGERLPVAA